MLVRKYSMYIIVHKVSVFDEINIKNVFKTKLKVSIKTILIRSCLLQTSHLKEIVLSMNKI